MASLHERYLKNPVTKDQKGEALVCCGM